MSEIVLEVKDLAKSYGHTVALDGVSFEIRRGETLRSSVRASGSQSNFKPTEGWRA